MTEILNPTNDLRPLSRLPETDEEEEHLMGEAVWDALRRHKANGNPIAVWEDGKVKIIQPEDIVLPEDATPAK